MRIALLRLSLSQSLSSKTSTLPSTLKHPSPIFISTTSFSTFSTMPPKKRQPPPSTSPEPEASTSQPPSKKQKSTSSSITSAISKKAPPHTEKAAKSGKGAPGAHPNQSDYNPNRGKAPKITPLEQLREAIEKHEEGLQGGSDQKDGNVVHWMRMRDLRIEDNRGLSQASELAEQRRKAGKSSNLVVLHVLSPADFKAHDTSSRKVDFLLRNLSDLKAQLSKLSIPLVTLTLDSEDRTSIASKVIEFSSEIGATSIFGNIEFEVNELWRDVKLIKEAEEKGLEIRLLEDTYVVPPGNCTSKEGKPYSVFSPWNKNWINQISENMDLLDESPLPSSNDSKNYKQDSKLQKCLSSNSSCLEIPTSIPGFECSDSSKMTKLWPSGSSSAFKVIENFFGSASDGKTDFEAGADKQGKEDSKLDIGKTRIGKYGEGRNIMSTNGTSRLSPYLSSGVVSARHVLRETMKHTKKLNVGRDSGIAMFNTEISFRDFYGHVLSAFPRVCMGRCYIPKYEDIVWNYDEEELEAWKEGKTGYPIVDASMRQLKGQGYMHNRGRMIVSMFLTKHLLHDWREGEQHFMKELIDCDFASNNGGWQWSASTGTDPQPYFRIFNPLAQSEKSDPSGDFIRHWVPELSGVKGKAIHAPFDRLNKKEFEKLDYPKPIVEHTVARKRALARFKNPGFEGDGDE